MDSNLTTPPNRRSQVDLTVHEYETAVARGESPDRAELLARHPELAAYFRDRDARDREERTEEATPRDPEKTEPYIYATEDGVVDAPGTGTETGAGAGWPERLGDYLLGEKLGGGGQGLVFRARHRLGEFNVALKMVAAKAGAETFQDEIRAIASLRHEHIVRVLTFGRDQGLWYYTMEEMEGGSFQDRLQELKADLRKAVSLLQQVAIGVHHAHSRGILHLDLKPANILIDGSGRSLVSDFGLAKRLYAPEPAGGGPGTAPGARDVDVDVEDVQERLALTNSQVRGTGPYMSPEMASGGAVLTTSADIYGLGAILYTLLTGHPPFRGRTLDETIRRVLWDVPVPPRTQNRKVDHELQAICLKCLHKNPLRRYGSADALANDLGRWLRREPTLAGKPTVGKQVRYWFRRHPLRVGAACLLGVTLWMAAAAGSLGELRAENRREAGRIAREVEIQLRMIGRAIDVLARQPDLRQRMKAFPTRSPEQRQSLDEFLTRAEQDYNDWFGIAGGNPLINVVILNVDGVLIADTLPDSRAVGMNFSRRDYFHALMGRAKPGPRTEALVSRAFHSVKDSRYKISLSTRIWDGDDCLGVLVANLPIGRRLVALDLADEPEGATVISPVDWSYTDRSTPPSPFLTVLDRRYPEAAAEPIWPDPDRFPRLAGFARDPAQVSLTDRFRDGAVMTYHRVGRSPLIVVLSHTYPWPLRLLLDPRLRWGGAVALVVSGSILLISPARRALARKPRGIAEADTA